MKISGFDGTGKKPGLISGLMAVSFHYLEVALFPFKRLCVVEILCFYVSVCSLVCAFVAYETIYLDEQQP